METRETQLETLSEIRNLMERSSRFISLSGLSGVFAGIFALLGAGAAWLFLDMRAPGGRPPYMDPARQKGFFTFFFADALSVLVASIAVAIILTTRHARRKGLKVWDASARRMVINLFIPVVTGGIFCFILLGHEMYAMIAAATLIFYGLGLLNASKYTHNDVRYLGLSEIVVGLLAAIYLDWGLIFWAIGFGILHIIYGTVMYYKYER